LDADLITNKTSATKMLSQQIAVTAKMLKKLLVEA
jgi:hypothetical protein